MNKHASNILRKLSANTFNDYWDEYDEYDTADPYACSECGSKDVEFTSSMGSPGMGDYYKCTNCNSILVKFQGMFIHPSSIDSSEPPPWELNINDVI